MIEASFNFYAILNFWRSNERKTEKKITPVRKVTFIMDREACLSTFKKETVVSDREKEACLPAEEPEFYAPAIKKELPVEEKPDVFPVEKDFTSDCPVEKECNVSTIEKETLSKFTIEETIIVPLIENKSLIDDTFSVCAIEEESAVCTIEEESAVLAEEESAVLAEEESAVLAEEESAVLVEKDPIVTSTDQNMFIVSAIEEKESPELVSTFEKESPVVSLQKEKTVASYTEDCSGAVFLEKESQLLVSDALPLKQEPLDIGKSVSIPLDMARVTVKELCGSDKESPVSTVQYTLSTVQDNEEEDADGALRGLVDAIAGIISGPDIIPAVDNYLDSLDPKIPLNRIDSAPSTLNTGKGYLDQVTHSPSLSFPYSMKHHVPACDEADLIIEVINRNEVDEESEESSSGDVVHNKIVDKEIANEEIEIERLVNVEVVDNCLVTKVVKEDSVHVERNGQSTSRFSKVKALFKKWFCCTVDESSVVI